MIGGIGGGASLIILFLACLLMGYNPLNSEYLFWDVLLLSFSVFLAALNYHIKRKFQGYKILQTIVLNALATLLGIMIYVTFLGLILPSQEKIVEEYKSNSYQEVSENRESFLERGLKEEDIDIYLEDIRSKTSVQITMDTLQKLFLASPFIVFIAFVLILLMHFVLILSRDKVIKNQK